MRNLPHPRSVLNYNRPPYKQSEPIHHHNAAESRHNLKSHSYQSPITDGYPHSNPSPHSSNNPRNDRISLISTINQPAIEIILIPFTWCIGLVDRSVVIISSAPIKIAAAT